jgi:ribonuclease J
VTALLSDSTGARTPGDNPGERSVHQALQRAVEGARGRAVVTTFTSHIHRLRQLLEIAVATGRQVALVGRSATENVQLARRAGLLTPESGLLVDVATAIDLPPSRLLVVATGCQGEPRAALARMARGAPGLPPIQPGDRVVFSARIIPGNELHALQVANGLARRGAEVIFGDGDVHVSGHGYQGDLEELLRRLRPRVLIPVHGDRLHLQAHAHLAERLGIPRERIAVVDNGQPVELFADVDGWRYRGGAPVELCTYLLEQEQVLPIDASILAARQNAARRGVLGVAIPLHDGRARPCRLSTSGVAACALGTVLVEAQAEVDRELAQLDAEALRDPQRLEQAAVAGVRRAFRRRALRPPQVVVLSVPV